MFTFFEGPEPSDGLRVKKISSASSTDCDMMIGGKAGKASCGGDTLGQGSGICSTVYNKRKGNFTPGVSLCLILSFRCL